MKWQKTGNAKEHIYHLHWSFLLILAWMVIVNIIEWQDPAGIIWALLLIASYMLSLFFHELGHHLAGRMLEFEQNQLLVLPSGAVGRKLGQHFTLLEKLLVRLSGPATNLLIAGILKLFILPYAAYWNEPANMGVVDAGNFLFQLHLINLGLGLVNLLPVMPMDGGSMLKDMLSPDPNSKKADRAVGVISKSAAFIVIVIGMVFLQLYLILLGVYILITRKAESHFFTRQEHKRLSIQRYHAHRFPFSVKSIM